MGHSGDKTQNARQDDDLRHIPAVRRPKLLQSGLLNAVEIYCFFLETFCQRRNSSFCQKDGSKIASGKYDHRSGKTMISLDLEQKYLQPAISGKIADLLDYPVSSARVALSGRKLAEKLYTVTGEEGHFMFSRVPPGSYTLEVTYSGFSKLVQRGIIVRDHTIAGLDLKMDFKQDSREINLWNLSLQYINGNMNVTDKNDLSMLPQQLNRLLDGIHLDKVQFNPPEILKTGHSKKIEFGVYQNLKEEIIRRLLARNICCFDRDQIEVTLKADLQVAGCQVLLLSAPLQAAIDGARYLGWEWEILPQTSGLALVSLHLEANVRFAEYGEQKKCLLTLDRDIRIKKSHLFAWQRFFKTC
jgi:hypothetical protein